MTTILNFKKVEVVAESREAAIAQVENTLFHINGDATQAFKNWKSKQTKGVTERDVKEFMLDYLAKKGKNCPGAGYLITVESSVADTRERPYKIENVKNEGRRKTKKTLVWVDDADGHVVCEVVGTKAEANNALKELYKSGAYKGNASCKIIYNVNNPIVSKAKYTPSKNTKKGNWLAFGIEA